MRGARGWGAARRGRADLPGRWVTVTGPVARHTFSVPVGRTGLAWSLRGDVVFSPMTAGWGIAGDADAAEHLGEAMSQVARALREEHGDVDATLRQITAWAVQIVPGAQECGISYVLGRSRVEPRAPTGDLARDVDVVQQRLGHGPCLDAVWQQDLVRVDDVGADRRWPQFARQASQLGAGSLLCLRLFVAGNTLSALNCYARTPGAFDERSQQIGRVFASHAAVALAGATHEEHLRAAVHSRDVIGQAKGIVMERYKLTADQAFGVLTRASQETNRKVVDIATELTHTGAVPPPPRGPSNGRPAAGAR